MSSSVPRIVVLSLQPGILFTRAVLKISVPFGAAWLLFSLSSLSLCWPPALSKTMPGSNFASDESRPPGFT